MLPHLNCQALIALTRGRGEHIKITLYELTWQHPQNSLYIIAVHFHWFAQDPSTTVYNKNMLVLHVFLLHLAGIPCDPASFPPTTDKSNETHAQYRYHL